MNEAKYSMNQVIYFVHPPRLVKGVIDEIVLHYTQKNVIIKYIIRPYGLEKFVTIDEDKIYTDLQDAKNFLLEDIKQKFTKGNIIDNYEQAKEEMEKKYLEKINNFDSRFTELIDSIKTITDEVYDKLEKNYQENKEKKDA